MKSQKLTTISLTMAVIALAAYVFINKNNGQVVYVETGILLQQYEGMKKARIDIEAKNKEYSTGVDSLINLFQADLKAYEKERRKMSSKERELKEELLRVRQQQVGNYQQAMQKKAQEEEQKITQTQVNRINDYMKSYGKEKGYQYILGANGSGNVVYAEEGLNITNDVLEGLNAQYKLELKE